MNNRITATIPFDYKGERHSPSAVIDLDDFIALKLDINSIYSKIARANQIGLYSYELEVMEASEISFSSAEGFAQQFLDGNQFDLDGFKNSYHDQKALQTLQTIAQKHLQVEDLDQEPSLKEALLDAYRYGVSLSQN